jgi:hypothetical protein
VQLAGPQHQWVVLGSFIPLLYSGTLIALLFGLKDFLTLTLVSHNYFPRRALILEDHLLHQKILRISLDNFSRPLRSSPYNFVSPTSPYGWLLTLVIHTIIPRRSCYYKMPRNTLHFPRILWVYCLAVLSAWKTLRLIPHIYRGSVYPDCSCVSQKFLRNTFWSSENPLQLVALEILACLHYG